MFIADALSRSYRLTNEDTQHDSSEVRALREVRHTVQMDFQYHPNGWKSSQFSSSEFANLAEAWKFEHKTLSPHHPQSNRKAENAVKICKNLLKKA